ncbi:unnamed protein product [Amaranthus hypochondriacus]
MKRTIPNNSEDGKLINENGVTKPNPNPFYFFKLIISPTSQSEKLRIPEEFARKIQHTLSSTISLKLPTGETWKVGILKEENCMLWMHHGWQEFMEHFNIQYAYFLLFEYEGNSNFTVLIFNPTGCEISYATSEQKQETLPINIQNLEDDVVHHNNPEILNSSSNSITPEPEVIQLYSDDDDDDNTKVLHSSLSKSENFGEESTTIGRSITAEEERLMKAIVSAGISLPIRPYFITLIKHYALERSMFLNIPVSFCHKYLVGTKRKEVKLIKLEAYGGKQWTVRCISFRSKCTFGAGWIIFARDEGLEVGDACVFELTDANNYVLKVDVVKKSQIGELV